MLTQHLRELAKDRLIERVDFGEMPLRVEYQLSQMGRQLLPVLMATRRFLVDHPRLTAATRACGELLRLSGHRRSAVVACRRECPHLYDGAGERG